MAYTKYSLTPANNNAAPPDGAPEGMLPSAVNDTMRDMMAQIRDCGDGIRGGTYTMTAPVITGGSINNTPIGASTANTGAFTTLSASSTVSGTGFSNYFASPPALGGTAAAAVSSTNLSYTGTLTGGTGVVNLGSGQFYKDASGNVGIGTNSPSSFGGYTTVSVNNATNGGIYNILVNGTETARLQAYSGIFNIAAKGASTVTTFETNGTERMRIDSSGNLLVGSTTNTNNSKIVSVFNEATQSGIGLKNTNANNAGYFLAFYNSSGTLQGSIVQNGASNVTYATSSDYRLKENIAPMTGALNVVQQLKPVTYNWKADGSNGQGFIAHELAEIFSEAVVGKKDAVDAEGKPVYQGIDTSFLVATLTAAIQELKAQVDAQALEIQALKAK